MKLIIEPLFKAEQLRVLASVLRIKKLALIAASKLFPSESLFEKFQWLIFEHMTKNDQRGVYISTRHRRFIKKFFICIKSFRSYSIRWNSAQFQVPDSFHGPTQRRTAGST